MKNINILLSNNLESDPFLFSQLLDIYKGLNHFDKTYVFCDGTEKKQLYTANVVSNAATKQAFLRYIIYYINLCKLLIVNRNNNLSIHVRGFVSGVLFYFVPKFFLKSFKYIYDPRGAFLAERLELGNSPVFVLLSKIEKKLIAKSVKTIVTTNKFKELFIKSYGHNEKYLVCYNSSSFKTINSKIQLENLDKINICYCGSINHWHNLDEIVRVVKYLYMLFPGKARVFFFTSKKNKQLILEKLKGVDPSNIVVDFIPYKKLESELSKMHVCVSVVEPVVSTKIASPIKVSDYILQNKIMVLNEGIGDFDEFYKINNSALLYKYEENLSFTAQDLFRLETDKNAQLIKKLSLKTNKDKILKHLLK